MTAKRSSHAAAFQARVALAAVTGDKTANELAAQFGVQVWSADITYLPLRPGSRTRRPPSTGTAGTWWRGRCRTRGAFCQEMLGEALATGTPEVFDTGQGV